MKNYILYTLLLLLAGCATISQNECQVADWQAIGFQYGSQGKNSTVFEQYRKDCAKYQIKADFKSFQQGYQHGLNEYCSFENGLSTGEGGAHYNNQCPRGRYPHFAKGYHAGLKRYCTYDRGYTLGTEGESAHTHCDETEFPEFKAGNRAGYARFEVSQNIEKLEDELLTLEDDIERNKHQIKNLEEIIVSGRSTPSMRADALKKIKHHEREKNRLEHHWHKVKEQLAHQHHRLRKM